LVGRRQVWGVPIDFMQSEARDYIQRTKPIGKSASFNFEGRWFRAVYLAGSELRVCFILGRARIEGMIAVRCGWVPAGPRSFLIVIIQPRLAPR
jgi:hypothetical protein